MKDIKDNSLQYYLLHHSAVFFGTCFISRFIKLLQATGLTHSIATLSVSSFGLIFLVIWMFWCYQNHKSEGRLIEKLYKYGMIATINLGLIFGFI